MTTPVTPGSESGAGTGVVIPAQAGIQEVCKCLKIVNNEQEELAENGSRK